MKKVYDPDYAPNISFNDWMGSITNQLARDKAKLAMEKNKVQLHESNHKSARQWSTREFLKRGRYEP